MLKPRLYVSHLPADISGDIFFPNSDLGRGAGENLLTTASIRRLSSEAEPYEEVAAFNSSLDRDMIRDDARDIATLKSEYPHVTSADLHHMNKLLLETTLDVGYILDQHPNLEAVDDLLTPRMIVNHCEAVSHILKRDINLRLLGIKQSTSVLRSSEICIRPYPGSYEFESTEPTLICDHTASRLEVSVDWSRVVTRFMKRIASELEKFPPQEHNAITAAHFSAARSWHGTKAALFFDFNDRPLPLEKFLRCPEFRGPTNAHPRGRFAEISAPEDVLSESAAEAVLSLTTWGDKCWIERATLYDPEKLFSLAKLEGRLHRVETEREILAAWALNLGFEVRISNRMENLVSLGIVDDRFATEFMRRINDSNQLQHYLNSGIVTGNQECDTYLATARKKHDHWLRRYLVN